MLNKICVLTVKVHNMNEALDFYTNVLGFKVSKRYGEKIVSLVNTDYPIVLEEEEGRSSRSGQGVLFGLVSENLNEDIEFLKSKGAPVMFDEPRPCPPGLYTVIKDPSGNEIELLEFSSES
ncbi:VOC family protein [Alkalihalobacillus sp. AL-G]|uniref:VOC family protein n=1 Tax=Alkalihalobacillus sp. AL-G TaxID=2926399 RepID=UPI00272D9B38|nr:VOC family protein [Alkalihalobacillus sp. AL-G]WLD94667.1 VOC family protein [Alkalihalobacillus sp. AL-G]